MERSHDIMTEAVEQQREGSEAPFEMANLFSKHTGLPFVVWISYKGSAQHDIRVGGPSEILGRRDRHEGRD